MLHRPVQMYVAELVFHDMQETTSTENCLRADFALANTVVSIPPWF